MIGFPSTYTVGSHPLFNMISTTILHMKFSVQYLTKCLVHEYTISHEFSNIHFLGGD